MRMLDTFAGAGGWDLGARALGVTHIDRVENWAPANATAEAAGFGKPVGLDVRDFHTAPGEYDIHTGSPSCKRFSMAGNGKGRQQMELLLSLIEYMGIVGCLPFDLVKTYGIDLDAALTLEPLRLILEGLPRAVALEQAPSVLPIWEAYADALRARGYSTTTAVVSAEQYGVPQTRKRAVLLARRDGAEVRIPAPTHSRYYNRDPKRLDDGVLPWVSMAEALGWGMTERPSMTVTGSGSYTGGAEPFGNAARAGMMKEAESGRWSLRMTTMPNSAHRTISAPAPTIAFGHDAASCKWQPSDIRITPEEAATLQTFPDGYLWQGTKGQRYQQIGNAVPPRLAEALLRVLL